MFEGRILYMSIDYVEIANTYGTPMYIYDYEVFKEQYIRLKDSILPGAEIFYSVKANPLLGVCQLFQEMGCGMEIASLGELELAQKAKCPANKIIFTSPGKTYMEICEAIERNVEVINIESIEELEIVELVAKEKKKMVNVAIRINPNINNAGSKIKMTGVSSQFGIDENEIEDSFFEKIHEMKHICLVGIQVYMGTQNLNADDIVANTRYIIKMALRLSKQYSFELRYINMGGGFGIAYFKNENDLDMDRLKMGMKEIYEIYQNELDNVRLIFESGRFLTAKAGKYICKVLYKKVSRDIEYVICDGGSNFHAASAFLGRFVRNNFPMSTIPKEKEMVKMNVVGPLCTPSDVIGQQVELNKNIAVGDLVVVDKSGAYGLTHSPLRFLSHETPIEVLVKDNRSIVLRERGKATDVLNGQCALT